uniref:putative nuclease HARBI1 n=1 Tax=Pristiophorus japonicus TaxID=55135 RepID=UPI00398F843B
MVIEMMAFYTSTFFQAAAGDICSISQHTIPCCIRQVTRTLYACRMDFIMFPISRDSQNERVIGFGQFAGFPKVQDAIDCTQIVLRAPTQNAEVIRNRKRYHPLNVQLVCDHTQRILIVNAHYPGSIHDAFILQAEQRYNDSHAATRNIIEQKIGMLKKRFRCLDCSGGILQYSPQQIVCYMLHNLAIMRGQALPMGIAGPPQEEEEDEEDEEEEPAEEPIP